MAKTKKVEVEKTDIDGKTASEDVQVNENAKPVNDKNSATVEWQGQTRTYNREDHGDNFMELAKGFAEKKGGEIVA